MWLFLDEATSALDERERDAAVSIASGEQLPDAH